MVNVPTSLNNSKTKVDDLDVCKLKTVSVDLKTISGVVDKKSKFNALKTKVNNLEKEHFWFKNLNLHKSGQHNTTVVTVHNSINKI